jgi:hypothetical protein
MTTPFTDTSRQTLKKRLHSKSSAGFPKLAHELVEQLSVISLCRFKIRQTFACDLKKPTQDCEALEKAVQEVARLIEEITDNLQLQVVPTKPLC